MSIKLIITSLIVCVVPCIFIACSNTAPTGDSTASGKPLRWGSDESGGAPYEFRDPENPEKRIGFEVEIVDEISRRLGRPVEFVQTPWETLIPSLTRNNFDFAMSGIEITQARLGEVQFTEPYYIYTQQLVTRATDTHFNTLADLKGRAVGTLGASAAEGILKNTPGIEVRSYDDNVRPYEDLVIGRVDGVLLDLPIAEHYARRNKAVRFAGKPFAPGVYAIAVRKGDEALRNQLDSAIESMKNDGSLQSILERWNLWNDVQTTSSE